MPKREDSLSAQKESSFEMASLHPEARSAVELWYQLQPEETDGSHHLTTISNCQLGHFRVEEQIGRGGMGAVYRAVDTRLDRVVALKVLSPSQSNDHGSVERFRNEARAAARMDHDNIARVYYVGEDQGLSFIAFEFVHGGNVKELIELRGSLIPADAVNYTLQIAQALRHTDAAGVVHRDIKPSNIIITPAGRAKLVDLGLARKRGPEASNDLTVDGTTLGTFDYISPEQAKDPKKVDVRSDIYSLGCTLYHMLTGEPPYPKGTMLQKLLDHQAKGIPDASEKNPRIPQELSAVVRKMMASDPIDRYASPELLIDDLRLMAHLCGLQPAAVGEEQWVSPRTADGWELWKQYGGWMITAALLLIVVFVIDYTQRSQNGANVLIPPDLTSIEPAISDPAGVNDLIEPGDSPPPSRPITIGNTLNGREIAGESEPTLADIEGPPIGSDGTTNNDINTTGSPSPSIARRELVPFSSSPFEPSIDFPPPIISQPASSANESLNDAGSSDSDEELNDFATLEERSRNREPDKIPLPGSQGEATIQAEPFTVVVNGVRRKSYPTLEAACSEAPPDASIELNFDGDTAEVQSPLKVIGKHLRILPAQGSRPTLRFSAPLEWQLGRRKDTVSMIEVSQGSLEIYNLDIRLEVSPDLNFQQWTVIALNDANELSLRGVSITAVNAGTKSVAIVELTEPVGRLFDGSSPSVVQIDAEDCFVRGQADLFLDHNVDPKVIRLNNVAVALEGTLLRFEGTDQHHVATDMNEKHVVQLELQNVTAWLDEGLASFDVQPNFSVPQLSVDADDSVIVVASPHPLIKMQGEMDLRDFEDRLEWSDQATYLQGPDLARGDPVWQISSPGRLRNLDRDEFDSRWNRRRPGTQRPVGQLIKVKRDVPFAQISSADLELSDDPENPAIDGAIDGSDAGVDWEASRLPQLRGSPDEND